MHELTPSLPPQGPGEPDRLLTKLGGGTRLLAAVTLLALTTNLVYMFHFRESSSPDTPTYVTAAANMVSGAGFVDSHGDPETLITPGYPCFIAVFLSLAVSLRYMILCQHLMLAVLIVATSAVSFRLFGEKRTAILTGVLLAIDLPMLRSANLILADLLFTAVFGVGLWLLWSASRTGSNPSLVRLFVAGVVCGLAVLVRPVALYFVIPASFYLWLVCKPARTKAILAFSLTFACFPGLWMARNYRQADYLGVSSITADDLLVGRASGVLAIADPGDFNENMTKRRQQLETLACADVTRRYGTDCGHTSFARRSEPYTRVAVRVLRQHPLRCLQMTARGAAVLLLDGDASGLQGITGIDPHLGIRLLLLYTVPVLGFAVIGLAAQWRSNRRLFWLALVTLGYFIVISAGGESYSRYRVPVIPLYLLLAATGASYAEKVLHRWRDRKQVTR